MTLQVKDDAKAKAVWEYWYNLTEKGCAHGRTCKK